LADRLCQASVDLAEQRSFLNADDELNIEDFKSATGHLSAETRIDCTLPAPETL
jgi:hypothetical protein